MSHCNTIEYTFLVFKVNHLLSANKIITCSEKEARIKQNSAFQNQANLIVINF